MKLANSCKVLIVCLFSLTARAEDCGTAGVMRGKINDKIEELKTRIFKDGSIAVEAPLAVNPDGGAGSYTVGDHGFTYIANGLSAWKNGRREPCNIECRSEFLKAEEKEFAPGTPEFCVFAMKVEPYAPGKALAKCDRGSIIGNGKGKLVFGSTLDTVTGEKIQSYVSTTSLQHLYAGTLTYLNAEALPIAVTPKTSLLGKVVWIGGPGLKPTYAMIGDYGPAFGEGSIALHQLLRTGQVSPQKNGPITVEARCTAAENLDPPFISKPNGGERFKCKNTVHPNTSSDIRAYAGIESNIQFVILAEAVFTHNSGVINEAVTIKSIAKKASDAGYTSEKISAMVSCLAK